ncbi:Sir2 family NAD-dependent protein deacetylase [Burkholderia vietnamiensis]|uniref:protein acetyllysine N-acetyltransferase n=1 Tax=Burkholderia vietnamiensis (strain G4 / LMG 22486) TaxID=269482 RepID=A4JS80_BURVG|nr:Sir2 family NAD-dependent protein deacetylase [Burkholderia vietnamiensis]ABO59133.1 Silent information regulator protein Sir2 [Burkholderia vietnamiensis G4]MBR8219850.1 RNA polymerase subunit sigma [Burkholderia vietnamiensis]MBR8284624.1 RNA polymerase subunit sigma [Burkholderia vietnamiensis]MCA8016731.1 RNA polymerase subunit sigma [Burkholderia vietnamiensis]MCB4347898.1 RNA polymerase subunit sigma [Burkholderia vietnamiensis]
MNEYDGIRRAADWIADADGIVIAAGAGMSVDSGLPDFRGTGGLWTSLLPAGMSERDVGSLTQGDCFVDRPVDAWRFYGRALQVCRHASPHAGYAMLRRWTLRARHGAFVFTSNVDGHFRSAGFDEDRVLECHGTINFMQCGEPCGDAIWSTGTLMDDVDIDTLEAPDLPRCDACGGLARPNFLMFEDRRWIGTRTSRQWACMQEWLGSVARPVVIEVGAGTAVPSVRVFAESLRGPLIRVNLDASDVKANGVGVGIRGRALDVLSAIDDAMRDA